MYANVNDAEFEPWSPKRNGVAKELPSQTTNEMLDILSVVSTKVI